LPAGFTLISLPLRRGDERRDSEAEAPKVAHGGWTRRGRGGFTAGRLRPCMPPQNL
jgi:hypothetical protein